MSPDQSAPACPGSRTRPPNLNAHLRAYTHADSCRLASMLLELEAGTGRPVTRHALADLWTARFPRHADLVRHPNKTIRHRISNAAGRMRGVGILRPVDGGKAFEITDRDGLLMAARNLAVAQDAQGAAVLPRRWTRLPEVPPHLAALLATRVQNAQQARPA